MRNWRIQANPLTSLYWTTFLVLIEVPRTAIVCALRNVIAAVHPEWLSGATTDGQTSSVKSQILNLFTNRLQLELRTGQVDMVKILGDSEVASNQEIYASKPLRNRVEQNLCTAAAIAVAEELSLQHWDSTDALRMSAVLFHPTIYVLDVQSDKTTNVVKYCLVSQEPSGADAKAHMATLPTDKARTELLPALRNRTDILMVPRGQDLTAHFATTLLTRLPLTWQHARHRHAPSSKMGPQYSVSWTRRKTLANSLRQKSISMDKILRKQ